jgi:hypothetical protein
MRQYDFLKGYDGRVLITFNKRTGMWAAEVVTTLGRNTRTAGELPSEASSHTLLSVALTTSLQSITKSSARFIAERAGTPKPRILVVSANETFLIALEAKMKGDKEVMARRTLKTGKQFLKILAYQLARFSITFETAQRGFESERILREWMHRHLIRLSDVPPSLAPSVVSQSYA